MVTYSKMNIPDNLQNYQLQEKLFEESMTHRSYLNEHPADSSNERLEFLGDAVLEFLISEAIYEYYPDQPEGVLTGLRANLVQTKTLSKVARDLRLGEHLRFARGEEQAGGRENDSLLENAYEALLGAIYLSSGIESSRKFCAETLFPLIETMALDSLKDPKSSFQEDVQAEGMNTPYYKVLDEIGPDHDKQFTVGVYVDNQLWAKGTGRSKQQAQQAAASKAVEKLHSEG